MGFMVVGIQERGCKNGRTGIHNPVVRGPRIFLKGFDNLQVGGDCVGPMTLVVSRCLIQQLDDPSLMFGFNRWIFLALQAIQTGSRVRFDVSNGFVLFGKMLEQQNEKSVFGDIGKVPGMKAVNIVESFLLLVVFSSPCLRKMSPSLAGK